jgi:murein DD-endopeptidase MepM/ murein hydrolase activator NlpD
MPYLASATAGPAALTPVTQEELAPAPIYTSSAPPPAPSASSVVTVLPGDTVYAVSRRTGASPDAIIRENALVAPYRLEIGQTLRIPSAERKIINLGAAAPLPAPPVRAVVAADRMHTVRPGDTLYAISRDSGVSPQTIAQANGLRAPYTLHVGQQILVPGARGAKPQREVRAVQPSPRLDDLTREVSYTKSVEPERPKLFDWPVKGAIIGRYGPSPEGRRNDGINISAPVGTPVRAAADGEVVYRGSELDGYGNLILIKHSDNFVTAYAHNDVMLVRKGEKVRQGQVIGKVGQTGAAAEPQLHFEIRQNLKSVDPLAFLEL